MTRFLRWLRGTTTPPQITDADVERQRKAFTRACRPHMRLTGAQAVAYIAIQGTLARGPRK